MPKTENETDFWPQRIATAKRCMASTQHYEATNAAVEVMEEGGNAFDAAAAAAFALCVCEPNASGLGGQTMMQIYLAGENKTFSLDGSSRVPSRAVAEFLPRKSMRLRGYRATTVPTTPAVLQYIVERYGRLSFSRILEPAIRLAEKGYKISRLQHDLQKRENEHWAEGNAGDFFLKDGKEPFPEGSLFRQPVLAGTLKLLSSKGIEEFYNGEIAAIIEQDMIENDGFIRRDDLANIPYPIERRPISCRFQGMRVLSFPPPGAGRTLVEMLNILNQFQPRQYDPDDVKGALLLAEIIRRSQLDRRDRPFDPSFYPQVQDRRMISAEYARLVAGQIRGRLKKGSGETTHLSVMDGEGNIAALTQSIERAYGSFVVSPKLGFLYNNYMSAFDYKDITHPYYLRPNSVPWASVAPTIVFKRKKPFIVIGSPGSERIASSILQVLIRLHHQSPLDAVTAPRFHCSIAGKVSLEYSRIRTDISGALEKRGFTLVRKEPFSFYLGSVQLVMKSGKRIIGVADPRRDGSAGGLD